jgi:hypothetical protein
MAMGKRERIGVVVLIGLFLIFGLLLYFTVERPEGPTRSIENNVLIEQRMKNIGNR